jgi:RimJ/RimL family protein N-acetyltransferase
MPDLTLRRALPADLDAIMALERRPGYEAFVGRSTRPQHEAMFYGSRHVYLIGERAALVAFALLRDLDDAHGNVYLQRIAVARPGEGEGARFLRLAIDWAFAHSAAHRFHLDCFEDNSRAQAMYAKLGFTRDGLLREAYLDPSGRRRTLVLMALTRTEWDQAARSSTTSAP